jgi:O-antigen ligase
MAYAAFAGGAAGLPEETWLQLFVALLAAFACVAWLGPRAVRPRAEPLAVAGIAALALFTAWTGISLLWSVTPDRTWIELNRAFAYTLVVVVALACGSAVPRAAERVAVGWLVVGSAVALYALLGKVFPGVFDHARVIARLRAPLEYWNALALVCVLAAPVALRVATTRSFRDGWRALAVVSLLLQLCVIGMTYSRGGFIALGVAVVAVTIAGRERIPGLIVFALTCVAAAPVLAVAYTVEGVSENAAPRAEQIDAGLLLGVVFVGCAAVLALVVLLLMRWEHRAMWDSRAWAVVAAVLFVGAAAGVALAATGDGGLRGFVNRSVDDFTEVRRDPIFEPDRLLTVSSGNRWAWWREATGAFSDEPVLGWGAGSFGVSRRLYRISPYDVQQPHSVPLQFLAELGFAGALLGLGALLLLVAAAVVRVRALPFGRERDLAGALLAAAVAWLAHAGIDWDWDIPGVTVPVLVFLGVLGARRAEPEPPLASGADQPVVARALGLAAAGLALCAFVASVVLPAWSDAKTDDAFRAVDGRPSQEQLEDAAADAELAARLDPLSVRPLFAAAAVAERRERLLEARGHLLDAVDRQPWSRDAWERLTRLAVTLADREGIRSAAQRTAELDPGNDQLIAFLRRSMGLIAPPESSATAAGTPLPGAAAPPAPPPR